MTAFYNKRTLLFTSYNNHPLDSVVDKLISMSYEDNIIPFPIIRLGNNEKVLEATNYIKQLYLKIKEIKMDDNILKKLESDTLLMQKC